MRTPSALARMFGQRAWLLAIALFLFGGALEAQVSERITAVRTDAYRPGTPLHVTVDLATATGIVGAHVHHRGVNSALVRVAQEEKFGRHVVTAHECQIWCTSSATGVTMPV